MTHWWAPFALLAILVVYWLVVAIAFALETDRGWTWWRARGFIMLPILGLFFLMQFVVPEWGGVRQAVAIVIVFLLLVIGDVIHERQTGRRLIRLPKKS